MTYKKRSMKVQFTLYEGSFDSDGNDVLTIDNIKAELSMAAYGGIQGQTLDLKVNGLSLEHMALISYKGIRVTGSKMNLIKVWFDDELIFFGAITGAFMDLNQMPDAPLIISATATGYDQTKPAAPFSASGSVNVVDILTAISKSVGYEVDNSGVSAQLSDPHFSGNPVQQINAVCQAAGINHEIAQGILTIWPQGGKRDDIKPLISPSCGLLGYPVFAPLGINFNTIYSSLLKIGREVQVDTSLPNASGDYTIIQAEHYISTWVEGGPCQTTVYATPQKLQVTKT